MAVHNRDLELFKFLLKSAVTVPSEVLSAVCAIEATEIAWPYYNYLIGLRKAPEARSFEWPMRFKSASSGADEKEKEQEKVACLVVSHIYQ